MSRYALRFRAAILGAALFSIAFPAAAGCPLRARTPGELRDWKDGGFAVADAVERNTTAVGLVACLDDPDPFVRDGVAFEALAKWMRGKQLDTATLRTLGQRLLARLEREDDAGFGRPFAALVLSEVARTDRVEPWMSAEERARMADAAAAYIASVRDHRGYVDGEGWRHGVAHGADWALQLVLNKAVTPAQAMSLLDGIGSQVAPADGHAYAFGEPVRFTRAVVYAVARGDLDPATVKAWTANLVVAIGPRPQGDPQAAWWTRRSNLENFLYALGYQAAGEQSPALQALEADVRGALRAMP